MNQEELLNFTNCIIKGWKFVPDTERECFKLVKIGAIQDDGEKLDEHVADIYDMETFFEWLEELKGGQPEGKDK